MSAAAVGACGSRETKRGQVIENKQFREMPNFAPPMISRTYDPGAKCFVSFGEMNPVGFAGFAPRRGSKRKDCEINAVFGLAGRKLTTERLGNGAASH
jgi:hypothetical protein